MTSSVAGEKSRDEIAAAEPRPVWKPPVEGRGLAAVYHHPQRTVFLRYEEKASASADAPAQADQPRVHQTAEEVQAFLPRPPEDYVQVGVNGNHFAALGHAVDLGLGPADESVRLVRHEAAIGRKTIS